MNTNNKNLKNVLDNFIDPENQNEVDNKLRKKIIIDEREGLIERIDHQYITKRWSYVAERTILNQ